MDIQACQRLRALAFVGASCGSDADEYDAVCDHLLIEDTLSGDLVASYRMMYLENGETIDHSYSAQYYQLAALKNFPQPMLEIGRFCIRPGLLDSDILRIAWATITRIVDRRNVRMLFGCSSFIGIDATEYRDTFAVLKLQHQAPERWRPQVKSSNVVPFEGMVKSHTNALRTMPPMLRTYLMMGGWVSDHAVVDRELNTLHVFVGVETAAIPQSRKRLLRAVAR